MAFGAVDVLALVSLASLTAIVLYRKRTLAPPGPQGWPIIGNALNLPSSKYWLTYDRWSKAYGDVLQFTSFGERTVILSSAKAVHDLFELRGNIYSDRPPAPMAGELVGWNKGLGYARFTPHSLTSPTSSTPYPVNSSARFRVLRRMFQDTIGPQACRTDDLKTLQEKARDGLLRRLMRAGQAESKGGDFNEEIWQAAGSFMLLVTYGYEVPLDSHVDPLVKIVERAMEGFSRASEPGAFWVDYMPFLRYIPAWVPGARFQREAAQLNTEREMLYEEPYRWTKAQTLGGNATPSMVSGLISSKQEASLQESDEELIMAVAASLYSGGADTTHATLNSLLLAMSLYPSIQTRAQAELDALLSSEHRLPTLDDRPDLPYVEALMKELWRWNPSVPLGLAHRVAEDNVYRGMEIKEGTTVYANIWSLLHDEETYPDPFVFNPDRYLDSQGQLRKLDKLEDPSFVAFGLGRRICPGMHLADATMFLYIASILYAFRIEKALDEKGEPMDPVVEYDGFISKPKSFKCRLIPRNTFTGAA
ncbi:unnamed protein product [Peniophora sp. CBMAI 1063]|nr:unnamed protein product [Peniophora sp. CBMAI 1063]